MFSYHIVSGFIQSNSLLSGGGSGESDFPSNCLEASAKPRAIGKQILPKVNLNLLEARNGEELADKYLLFLLSIFHNVWYFHIPLISYPLQNVLNKQATECYLLRTSDQLENYPPVPILIFLFLNFIDHSKSQS